MAIETTHGFTAPRDGEQEGRRRLLVVDESESASHRDADEC
jgi:hypothetical protein